LREVAHCDTINVLALPATACTAAFYLKAFYTSAHTAVNLLDCSIVNVKSTINGHFSFPVEAGEAIAVS
jgi:hypothetical protein